MERHQNADPLNFTSTARAMVLLLVTLASGFAPAAGQSVDLEELASYVERARIDWEIPGISVGIVQRDAVLFAGGFGVRDLDTREPVDAETVYAIASTTKAFTAAAIGILVDEERMDWEDRAVDHLPGFRLYDDYLTGAITVRDLLSHTSGLPRGDRLWFGSEYDRRQVLHRVRHLKPERGLRQEYGYSNIMFLAAGETVAAVTGQSWDDFLQARFFRPLSMDRTTTSVRSLMDMPNVATPHVRLQGRVRRVAWRNVDNVGAAGAVNSSVSDMVQWLRLHLNRGEIHGRRILSEEAVEEIFTPNTVVRRTPEQKELFPEIHLRNYGLGWVLQDYRGHGIISHGGAIDGMRAEVALVPEMGLGVVVLSNLGGGGSHATAIAFGVLDRFMGPREKDWSETLLAAETAAREEAASSWRETVAARAAGTSSSLAAHDYAGSYTHPMYGSLLLEAEESGLVASRGPHMVGDLTHWHHDTFQVTWRDPIMGRNFLTFSIGPRGNVASFDLDPYGTFTPVEDQSGHTP